MSDATLTDTIWDASACAGEAGAYWYRSAIERAAKCLEISADEIRLHAGEMTAQEMRSVKAVLKWKAAQIRGMANV